MKKGKDFIKKLFRFLFYSLQGKFEYSCKQFEITNAIYAFIIHLLNSYKQTKSNKVAIFEINRADLGRYTFNIFHLFKLNGYTTYLIPKYSFYSSLKGLYAKDIFTFINPKILLIAGQLKKKSEIIYITDSKACKRHFEYDLHIYIDYLTGYSNYSLTMPYPFHPLVYINNEIRDSYKLASFISKLRMVNKEIKVLFAGQVYHESYENLNNNFSELINRNRLFNLIFKNFSDQISDNIYNNNQPIIISDSNKNNVKHEDWLYLLSKASFFIAAPGFEMPFCHNIIEAMACGTIPIIQYGSYFTPSLEDGVNCLEFKDSNDLIHCLSEAINMNESEIVKIRSGVLKYYECHLSPISFLNNALAMNKKAVTFSQIIEMKQYLGRDYF